MSENGEYGRNSSAITRRMNYDTEHCYQALLTHDPRFDGVFYVGVSTTGIYCRTVCTAKTPRRDRCTFYPSAAAAEHAGFRPCLRCRPELAPGNARIDAVSRLAAAVADRIEDGDTTDLSFSEIAAELGVSDRHLRRVVEREFGVTPIELAQTQRLLLAKRLLTDTDMSVIDVAFASGFSSLRRFNALFKERYRLNPTDLRKSRTTEVQRESFFCELAYRPPFDWNSLLDFLGRRTVGGVEAVDGNRYLRTVSIGKYTGWIAVAPMDEKPALKVEISTSLAPALRQVLARVKRLFDLTAAPSVIAERLGDLASAHPGLRVPGAFDGFEVAVRAILGQQVSVKAATTLAGRFSQAFGAPIETKFEALNRLTPTPQTVASLKVENLTTLGILETRARSIQALAGAVAAGELTLEPRADVEATIEKLLSLPGIGDWTAQYIGMRALAWPDAFPHGDLGIVTALNQTNKKRVLELAEAWRPWRAYAAMHLWKSLENKG